MSHDVDIDLQKARPTGARRPAALRTRLAPVRRALSIPEANDDATGIDVRRQVLAEYCTLIARRLSGNAPKQVPPLEVPDPINTSAISDDPAALKVVPALSNRQRQTLEGLLAGESEKQIARKLGISYHTTHDHVRKLYQAFSVNSRGELLARFVRRSGHS